MFPDSLGVTFASVADVVHWDFEVDFLRGTQAGEHSEQISIWSECISV